MIWFCCIATDEEKKTCTSDAEAKPNKVYIILSTMAHCTGSVFAQLLVSPAFSVSDVI